MWFGSSTHCAEPGLTEHGHYKHLLVVSVERAPRVDQMIDQEINEDVLVVEIMALKCRSDSVCPMRAFNIAGSTCGPSRQTDTPVQLDYGSRSWRPV
jgi:hypothetical protein